MNNKHLAEIRDAEFLAEIEADEIRKEGLDDAITTLTLGAETSAKREEAKRKIIEELRVSYYLLRFSDWSRKPRRKRGELRKTLNSLAGTMRKASELVGKLDGRTFRRLYRAAPDLEAIDNESGDAAEFFKGLAEACKETAQGLPNRKGGNPTDIEQHDLALVCVDLLEQQRPGKKVTHIECLRVFQDLYKVVFREAVVDENIGARACRAALAKRKA